MLEKSELASRIHTKGKRFNAVQDGVRKQGGAPTEERMGVVFTLDNANVACHALDVAPRQTTSPTRRMSAAKEYLHINNAHCSSV